MKNISEIDREFDLIVFGASGFTGQFVVEEVTRTAQKEPIKWGISGRNAQKLADVLITATKETGIVLKDIPRVEADINNEESLKAMTARTRLVLNCVGPYRFFGEQMIKACIETATNHLDISGEPQYMESMQLKYNKVAEEKGIYIISACGFDSVPIDMGIRFLKKNFYGELNEVETNFNVKTGPRGWRLNYGTFHSAIYALANTRELVDIHQRLSDQVYTKKTPTTKFKLERKLVPFYSEHTKGWCLPYFETDRSVVQRTEQFRYEEKNERPIQIECYFTVGGFLILLGSLLMGVIFWVLASFEWGRSLLKSYPRLFSFGMFTKTGPTREEIRATSFVMSIVGKGWAEKLSVV